MALLDWLKHAIDTPPLTDPTPELRVVPYTVEAYGALLRTVLPQLVCPKLTWRESPETFLARLEESSTVVRQAYAQLLLAQPPAGLEQLHYAIQELARRSLEMTVQGSLTTRAWIAGDSELARLDKKEFQKTEVDAFSDALRVRAEVRRLRTTEPALWQRLNIEGAAQAVLKAA